MQLRVVQNQKFIHVTEGGEVKPYKSEVRISAKDIDNAREIAAIVLKMIEEGEEILKNRINASSYDEYLTFLEKSVGDVNTASAAVAQSFKPVPGIGSLVEIKVTESGKKSTNEYLYHFNIADLNEHGLKVIVKSTEVKLEVPTFNKLKLIKVSKNGEHFAFQSEITLDFATIDLARDVQVVLGEFIPLAKEKLKNDMPDFKTTRSDV